MLVQESQNLSFSFAEDEIDVDDASSDEACAEEESVDAGFVSSEGEEHSDAVTPGGTRFAFTSSVLISQSFFFWVDDEDEDDDGECDFG